MPSLAGVAPLVDLPSRAKAVATIADEYGAVADQHGQLSPPVIRAAGRELAGLADRKKWVFLDLVDQA